MTFGARLTEARKKKGLTQEQAGKGLGTDGKDVSKAVVYGWEKDQHHPRSDQLAMLCEKLDCSADYLLFGKTEAPALTPEVGQVARAADSLPQHLRDRVLTLWRQAIQIANESLTQSSLGQPSVRNATSDVHQPRRKSS